MDHRGPSEIVFFRAVFFRMRMALVMATALPLTVGYPPTGPTPHRPGGTP